MKEFGDIHCAMIRASVYEPFERALEAGSPVLYPLHPDKIYRQNGRLSSTRLN